MRRVTMRVTIACLFLLSALAAPSFLSSTALGQDVLTLSKAPVQVRVPAEDATQDQLRAAAEFNLAQYQRAARVHAESINNTSAKIAAPRWQSQTAEGDDYLLRQVRIRGGLTGLALDLSKALYWADVSGSVFVGLDLNTDGVVDLVGLALEKMEGVTTLSMQSSGHFALNVFGGLRIGKFDFPSGTLVAEYPRLFPTMISPDAVFYRGQTIHIGSAASPRGVTLAYDVAKGEQTFGAAELQLKSEYGLIDVVQDEQGNYFTLGILGGVFRIPSFCPRIGPQTVKFLGRVPAGVKLVMAGASLQVIAASYEDESGFVRPGALWGVGANGTLTPHNEIGTGHWFGPLRGGVYRPEHRDIAAVWGDTLISVVPLRAGYTRILPRPLLSGLPLTGLTSPQPLPLPIPIACPLER